MKRFSSLTVVLRLLNFSYDMPPSTAMATQSCLTSLGLADLTGLPITVLYYACIPNEKIYKTGIKTGYFQTGSELLANHAELNCSR